MNKIPIHPSVIYAYHLHHHAVLSYIPGYELHLLCTACDLLKGKIEDDKTA